ncbi:hypothetical protein FACS1894159_03100 [Bacteroidia bacterium]|nr:hypothetical protein FACS1894159_03100 [Bacteroidia bacterium]
MVFKGRLHRGNHGSDFGGYNSVSNKNRKVTISYDKRIKNELEDIQSRYKKKDEQERFVKDMDSLSKMVFDKIKKMHGLLPMMLLITAQIVLWDVEINHLIVL